MAKEKKTEQIERLAEKLSSADIVIATDYRGLSVAEMTELRRLLQRQGVEYRVAKNTLTIMAAEKARKTGLSPFLVGPTALALASGDEVQLAKALIGYQSPTKSVLTIKGGLLEERALSAREIIALATLPPKEILVSRLLGMLNNPLYRLLFVLNAELRRFMQLLQNRINQLEGE